MGASFERVAPLGPRLTGVGRPLASTGSPSTPCRDAACSGSIPMMLSKDWFSIISTTMCSICGIVAVPSGRLGNGSAPGPRP